jgi:hypothetical protein
MITEKIDGMPGGPKSLFKADVNREHAPLGEL